MALEYMKVIFRVLKFPVVSKGVYSGRFENLSYNALLQHKYGHILQAKEWGNYAFYDVIAPKSLWSQMRDGYFGHNHDYFWTETYANFHANEYFNGAGGTWNGGFNLKAYPAQALSMENYTKLTNSRIIGRNLGF